MSPVVIPFDDQTGLAGWLARGLGGSLAQLSSRRFPDGETYIRLDSDVAGRDVVIASSLDHPDEKLVAIYLIASTAREMGARRVILATPYLAYLRQDTAFHRGESVSARHVSALLSGFLDGLVTLDPHLHRIPRLQDLFRIPAMAATATDAIAAWITANVPDALIVGPDGESSQWVSRISQRSVRPFTVLRKARRGDREVDIAPSAVEAAGPHTPVLVDDIISTGRTMIAAIASLRDQTGRAPVCIGVHGIFVDDAFEDLKRAGAAVIVTCNSVRHESNAIEIGGVMAEVLKSFLAQLS